MAMPVAEQRRTMRARFLPGLPARLGCLAEQRRDEEARLLVLGAQRAVVELAEHHERAALDPLPYGGCSASALQPPPTSLSCSAARREARRESVGHLTHHPRHARSRRMARPREHRAWGLGWGEGEGEGDGMARAHVEHQLRRDARRARRASLAAAPRLEGHDGEARHGRRAEPWRDDVGAGRGRVGV